MLGGSLKVEPPMISFVSGVHLEVIFLAFFVLWSRAMALNKPKKAQKITLSGHVSVDKKPFSKNVWEAKRTTSPLPDFPKRPTPLTWHTSRWALEKENSSTYDPPWSDGSRAAAASCLISLPLEDMGCRYQRNTRTSWIQQALSTELPAKSKGFRSNHSMLLF